MDQPEAGRRLLCEGEIAGSAQSDRPSSPHSGAVDHAHVRILMAATLFRGEIRSTVRHDLDSEGQIVQACPTKFAIRAAREMSDQLREAIAQRGLAKETHDLPGSQKEAGSPRGSSPKNGGRCVFYRKWAHLAMLWVARRSVRAGPPEWSTCQQSTQGGCRLCWTGMAQRKAAARSRSPRKAQRAGRDEQG